MQQSLKIFSSTYIVLVFFILTASVLSGQSVFEGKRVLVILKEKDRLQEALSIIESTGGHVTHIFPPRFLHAYVTERTRSQLDSEELIDYIAEAPVNSNTLKQVSVSEAMGLHVWNNLFITTVELPEDAIKKNPDIIPLTAQEINNNSVTIETNGENSQTSEYLIGSMSVGIIFVESNGQMDKKTETWTQEDKEHITEQIYRGLDWWSQMGGYRANASWTYDIKRCTTRYEPISRTKDESTLWVKDCMNQLGYTQGEDYERTRTYTNDLRKKYGAEWSFIIFVVPARNDADGYFANKSGIAWAYVGGPYMVIPSKCNGWDYNNVWKVVAHETGHIFNALDEYEPIGTMHAAAISNVTSKQKPEIQTNELCMMKSNDLFLCDHSRTQMGWIDGNQDGIFDVDHRQISSLYHHEKMIKESVSPRSSKLIFYENFCGQNAWYEDQNNYIENGAYLMYDSVYGSSSWLERDYYDFSASVKTQWIKGSAGSGYGLMVRVKTATDGYIFFINKHGQFAFGKYVNANWKYLAPWTYSDLIKTEAENILKAQCIENRFTLYINNEKVAEVFDDTFIYGNVGLAVLPEIQIAFDDLTILKP